MSKLSLAVSPRLAAALASVTVLLAFALNAPAQITNFWTGNASADWNNPANWTGNVLPTAIDTATVNDVDLNLATLTVNSVFAPTNLFIGDGATGTFNIKGGSLTISNSVEVGQNGGNGTVNMSGGTFIEGTGTEFNIGNVAGSTATWNMTNGTIISSATTRVGNTGSSATFNMYGGSLVASNYLSVGRDSTGVLNIYGGAITKTASAATTMVIGGGGTGTGTGTLNLFGGILDVSQNVVQVAFGGGSPSGTVNLISGQMLANVLSVDGGSGTIYLGTNATLTVGAAIRVTGTSPNGVFNFDGGKLVASGSSASFMTGLTAANVLAGGASIDTTNNTITITQSLLDGDGLGGGLTKLGIGTLFVNGTNTYTGPTLVKAGVLGGNAIFPGLVTVSTNGGMAPGNAAVGALTVGGLLTLNNNTTNVYEFNSTSNSLIVASGGLALSNTVAFSLFQEGTSLPYSAVGTYNLINYSGGDPTLNATWTTASASNPHIANPSYGFIYQFGISGGNLTLTISSILNIGTWGVDSDGNWSVAGNWTSLAGTMPPRLPSDSAIFGTGSNLRTVTLDANETVGAITMNNSNSFVIKGGNTLTLDRLGSGATINVTGGSTNAIQTSIALNDNIFATINAGEFLSLSGNLVNSSGAKTLSVTGAGTLALSGNNSYGPAAGSVGTLLSGGILQLGSSTALGAGDVTNSGTYTLQSGAANVSVPNKLMLGASTALIVGNDGNNNLTLAGVISGGGSLTKVGNDVVTLGATNTYSGFTTVSAGTLNVAAGAALSPATSSLLTVGSLSNTPAVMTNSGTISVNASSAGFNVGSGSDLIGTFNMGGGSLIENTAVRIGSEPASLTGINPGNGTFNLSGGTVTSLSYWQIGRNFGVGTMNMTGGNFFLGSAQYFAIGNSGANGTFNMSGGNLYTTNQILVAYQAGTTPASVGVWNLSGTANVVYGGAKRFVIGLNGQGTLNQSGGSFNYTPTSLPAYIGEIGSGIGGTGLWNMSAGTVTLASQLIIGDGTGSVGTLTLSGTAAMTAASIGFGLATGSGTLNLNGGTLLVNGAITNGTGSGSINFNGGTLKAGVSSTTFLNGLTSATVASGGAIIDTSANSITIGQALQDGGGALVKLGSGTLTLSGTNIYSGSTTVSNGTLLVNGVVAGAVNVTAGTVLGGNGSVSGVANVNGTIEAGTSTSLGTLTLGSSPVLGGKVVVKLDRNGGVFTNDLIQAGGNPLSYGGTLVLTNTGAPLQVNDTFKLFNTTGGYSGAFTVTSLTPGQVVTWNTANLTVNGTIMVATVGSNIRETPAVATPLSATAITYGQALSNSILSGTFTNVAGATVSGSLAFNFPGIVPEAGTAGQSVEFVPDDPIDYDSVTINVGVTVNKGTPAVSNAVFATAITYGQALSNSILSGTFTNVAGAMVSGLLAFNSPGTVPGLGTASQLVIFTPSDGADYNNVTINVGVTVLNQAGGIAPDPFLKADRLNIRNSSGTGDVIHLRGVNVGGFLGFASWMMPLDSSGILDGETAIRTLDNRFGVAAEQSLIRTYQDHWITNSDYDNIKAMGMNLIRQPFGWYAMFNMAGSFGMAGSWRTDAFDKLDWAVNQAWQRGIYTIIDLAVVEGGVSGSGSTDTNNQYWYNVTNQNNTIYLWQQIAAHYQGNPAVAGYDILNEPSGAPSQTVLWNNYNSIYNAIRAIDPDHIIVMESTWGNWSLSNLPNPQTYHWTNVVYSTHVYDTADANNFTAQTNIVGATVNDYSNHLSWGVPFYVGEFNCLGGGLAAWQYCTGQYNTNNINWSVWAYKADDGPSPDSWGLYAPANSSKLPPKPNLQTDSAATIQADWSQCATAGRYVITPNSQYSMAGPVVIDDFYNVVPDLALTNSQPGVMTNDSDLNLGRLGIQLVANLVTSPSNGQVILNPEGSFIYTPNSGFMGADNFRYSVYDGFTDSTRIGMVTLEVGSPTLTVATVSPVEVMLSWPSWASAFSLEQTTNLWAASWQFVAGTPASNNGAFFLSVPSTNINQQFFRLHGH